MTFEKLPPRVAVVFFAWLLLIFGTSCTVITSSELFALIQIVTGLQPDSMQRFIVFWGISWFVIVKGWHITEFAILTILCFYFARSYCGAKPRFALIVSMLFCMVFAATDEWHQSFIPDRFGTVQDVIIDSFGVLAASVFLFYTSVAKKQTAELK